MFSTFSLVYWFQPGCTSAPCNVLSLMPIVVEGFFSYLAQKFTSIRRCVMLSVYVCVWRLVGNYSVTVLWQVSDIFFHFVSSLIILGMCMLRNTFDLWPWPKSSRSFNHEFSRTAEICHIFSCLLHNTYSSGWILSISLVEWLLKRYGMDTGQMFAVCTYCQWNHIVTKLYIQWTLSGKSFHESIL